MSYKLVFKTAAMKEWEKLDHGVRKIFKKKLGERLLKPRHEASRLSAMPDCYKIKLKQVGFRLVYQVRDNELVVAVIAVGKREKNAVYKKAAKRV